MSKEQVKNSAAFRSLLSQGNDSTVGHFYLNRRTVAEKSFCEICKNLLENQMSFFCIGSENIPADIGDVSVYQHGGVLRIGVVGGVSVRAEMLPCSVEIRILTVADNLTAVRLEKIRFCFHYIFGFAVYGVKCRHKIGGVVFIFALVFCAAVDNEFSVFND